MFKKLLTLAVASAVSTTAFAQTKTASLEERVAELEANSSLNIFNFHGTLITRYDSLDAKQTKGAPLLTGTPFAPYDNKGMSYFRSKFSLDADANVSKYVKFYSRFSMSKFSNNLVRQNGSSTQPFNPSDTQIADAYTGSGVYVEKAYADLAIPDTAFVFSVGRLPTVDGTPYEYYDNRARMGTYPMMSYDSPLDGMSLTYKLDQYMPQNQKLALRFIYTPFSQVRISDDFSGAYQSPPTAGGNASTAGDPVTTNRDGYAGQVDYSLADTAFAENANFIVQYVNLNPLNITNPLKIGIQVTTVAADMKGIGGSRFDLGASYVGTSVKSEGLSGGLYGFGTNTDGETVSGSAALITARYRFTGWHIGAEYLSGTKGVFIYQGAAKDLTNFYATPGDGTHVFITKNFTELLSLRLGWTQQNYKYTPVSIGPIYESDKKVTTYYANLRLDF